MGWMRSFNMDAHLIGYLCGKRGEDRECVFGLGPGKRRRWWEVAVWCWTLECGFACLDSRVWHRPSTTRTFDLHCPKQYYDDGAWGCVLMCVCGCVDVSV
jgi:hypothetical protein